MPSASHVEIENPSRGQTEDVRADFQTLLREIHSANTSNLNSLHPRGRVLFTEGEPARGVYLLRSGRAIVSISSSEGKVVILRTARPGDVLGLSASLSHSSYDTTIKTLEPCRTDFVPRAELLKLMQHSHAATQAVLKIVTRELIQVTDRTRSLLLPQTASARLAKLLLDWSREADAQDSGRIGKVFTHEEIAQMICSTRETVTRLLASFGRGGAIQITSDSILILDRETLTRLSCDGHHINENGKRG